MNPIPIPIFAGIAGQIRHAFWRAYRILLTISIPIFAGIAGQIRHAFWRTN